MTLKNIFICFFFTWFLNGCAQNIAILGPIYTYTTTGNIYEAGITYSSNKAVKKITGKTTTENVKSLVHKKKEKLDKKKNYDESLD
tara:strand:+ start:479 stop:736 length:258 start_codon:yes stop_codon:yes gene_type:complete